MTAAPRVVFRADAGPEIGLGHARRCLTLAGALRELGVESLFVFTGAERAREWLQASDFEVVAVEPTCDLPGTLEHCRARRVSVIVVDTPSRAPGYLTALTGAGLRIRAVTQNRGMAACLGVRSRRVDALTFAFGAGLAGIAGCALTQIGNVGPELGQNYIVDSFMVVVTGGVGKLLGTILAALGIGGLNKIIEPGLGAVFGKVAILVAVILFIQRRPSGLFAAKGRYADS